MEMKIVRGVATIVLIMYLAIRDFFFFSSKISSSIINPQYQHDLDHDHDHQQYYQNSSSSTTSSSTIYQVLIMIYAKPSYLFIFFTFNILLVAVLLGISSQISKSSSPSHIELSIASIFIDDSHQGLKDHEDDQDKEECYYKDHDNYDIEEEKSHQGARAGVESLSYNNYINNVTNFNFFKNDIEIDPEEEVYGYGGYCHHHRQEYCKDDFIPGNGNEKVVLLMEGQSTNWDHNDHWKIKKDIDDEEKLVVPMNDDDHQLLGEKDEILICGYDDEDSMVREEDSYSELDDIDFNKRIEEFIDENNKKWREELQNDMLQEFIN